MFHANIWYKNIPGKVSNKSKGQSECIIKSFKNFKEIKVAKVK